MNFFAWGYGVSSPNPAKSFLRQSYEQFFRAPLEVGHRVSVVSGHQQGSVGKVLNALFNVIVVEEEASQKVEEYTADALKRIFRIGDTVRVHSAACINHQKQEGWVVEAQEDEITVVDAVTKTPVMCQMSKMYSTH
jgi:transcription elongation factor